MRKSKEKDMAKTARVCATFLSVKCQECQLSLCGLCNRSVSFPLHNKLMVRKFGTEIIPQKPMALVDISLPRYEGRRCDDADSRLSLGNSFPMVGILIFVYRSS